MELSSSNGWQDERGRVYLYFTVEQVGRLMGFGHNKVVKLFKELENTTLIDRKRRGLGKSSVIYPKRFIALNEEISDCKTGNFRNPKTGIKERVKGETNHTEYSHTEINDTESSIIYDDELLTQMIKYQIDYDILLESIDKGRLDEMVCIIADLMSIHSPFVKIGKYEYPQNVVRSRMKQINAGHIEYVLERLGETKTRIYDMRSYLASALFHAPTTMENYYMEEVNRDFGWK